MMVVNLDKLLPADIPVGERVVWHGRPDWVGLTRRAYRGDLIAAYFGVMTLWNFAAEASVAGWTEASIAAGKTVALGIVTLLLVCLLAWLSHRTTLYVVTSKRVVMKVGIALPIFFNIPFSEITSVAMHVFDDETGDLPLALTAGRRIAYLHLWPHARPFRFTNPEPSLRAVPKAMEVADLLRRALVADSREQSGRAGAVNLGQARPASDATRLPSGVVAA
jgi:hypothetical protein